MRHDLFPTRKQVYPQFYHQDLSTSYESNLFLIIATLVYFFNSWCKFINESEIKKTKDNGERTTKKGRKKLKINRYLMNQIFS